jgi:hypothetical protein
MATNTYVALQTQTLTSATDSVTFSSIPQTYTDLVLVINSLANSSTISSVIQVGNGSIDTGSNYSTTILYGDGTTVASTRIQGTLANLNFYAEASTTSPNTIIVNLQNYSNTTTRKTFLSRGSGAINGVSAIVGVWNSTSAINAIKVSRSAANNYAAGSTFTLYGIAKDSEVASTAKATGGTITYGVEHTYHVFTSSGTFTPTQALTADVLVIAGGGAGGGDQGGGGGAGGLLHQEARSLTSGTGYTCTVGAGGTASGTTTGNSGNNSVFDTITALGGGAGARNAAGLSGGSGGGGGYNGLAGGAATQGNSGGATGYGNAGSAHDSTNNLSGAGGGAGTAGNTSASSTTSGAGGAGLNTWREWLYATGKGVNGYIAGGGGGGNYAPQTRYAGAGGAGGGGAGADTTPSTGTAGTTNTGSGGGGGAGAGNAAGAGGSGIVIIRYAN